MESESYFYEIITAFNTTTGITITLAVVFLLFLIASLISGCEVAFFSLSAEKVNSIKEKDTRQNKLILKYLNNADDLLATITTAKSLINTFILILITFFSFSIIQHFHHAILIFVLEFLLAAFLVLFLEEKLSNAFAAKHSFAFVIFMVYPIYLLGLVLWPLNRLLIYTNKGLNNRLLQHKYKVTIDELSSILNLSGAKSEDIQLIKGIMRFADTDVKEVMKSRVDVSSVDAELNFKELKQILVETGYSRYPVYSNTQDDIKGILYLKDLLPHFESAQEDFAWQKMIRPACFVPESRSIYNVLKDLQKQKIHMAIVIDEYGGMHGIITLEDILEEIVGEIKDESDEDEFVYSKIDDHHYIFEGKVMINDMLRIVNLKDDVFDDTPGDSDTVAGLILDLRGEMPRKNESIHHKNFIFTIEAVDKRRIRQIRLTILPEVSHNENQNEKNNN